jgi:hypothetical protein
MAFQVSPGINVSEIDLTAGVQTTSLSAGAFVGPFQWGPALQITSVGSESDLVQVFGKPDTNTYAYWFSAQSFLAYSNQLRVVRAIANTALNATAEAKTLTGTVTVDISTNANLLVGSSTVFTSQLVNGQIIFIGSNTTPLTVANVINAVAVTVTTALTANVSVANTVTAYGVLVKNDDQQESSFSSGVSGLGLASAKWPGDLGNSLKISLCPSSTAFLDTIVAGNIAFSLGNTTVVGTGTTFTTDVVVGDYLVANGLSFQVTAITNTTYLTVASAPTSSFTATTTNWSRKWEYASQFDAAPGTSAFATTATGGATANDELHIVVVDQDGLFSGVAGTVLERFAFVSKASDAKDTAGNGNYYKNVLNNSAYVWWMGHVGTTTNWGSVASTGSFGANVLPYTKSFAGGNDANESVTDGNIESGWDLFADPDQTDVSLLITGPVQPNTVGAYVISNIAEGRKDAVAFVSPNKASVVNNLGSEVSSITTDRNSLPSSSYAVMDSGWKYQYDKYNDVYRWVPLNGDIAGLAARTDTTNDPWWSPAGFTRGNIKNVVKLAWTPKPINRDDLYKIGVNPVVSFPGQGVVLYGDKTLLSRPSAFDRINVRRLFIALEKTIARYAKAQLFEFNDEFTRAAFKNAVEPFLRDVKARRGVTDFLVVCDSTNNPAEIVDSNQFVGDIYVKPTRAINYIQLNFVAVRSGVSFQEVVGVV